MNDEEKKTAEQGQGGAQGPAPQQHEAEMPMLAASAAARLTQDILTRVNGPHGGMPSTPLRAGALWRQVTRRLGVSGQQSRARGPILFRQAMQAPGRSLPALPPVPQTNFVWRAVRHHSQQA